MMLACTLQLTDMAAVCSVVLSPLVYLEKMAVWPFSSETRSAGSISVFSPFMPEDNFRR